MSEAVEPYLWDRRHRLLYEIDLSTLYHRKRERHYDMCDRLAKALALIAGTAAISKATSDTWVMPTIGALVAVTSSFSLIFGYSEKARRHAEFARSFCEIGADLIRKGERDFEEPDLNECDAKIRTLEAQEPASLGALVRLCQNEIAVAQGHPEMVTHIPWHQHLLAHLWDFKSPARPFAGAATNKG